MFSTFISRNLTDTNIIIVKQYQTYFNESFLGQQFALYVDFTSVTHHINFGVFFFLFWLGILLSLVIQKFNLFNLLKLAEKELNSLNDLVIEVSLLLVFFLYFIYDHYIFFLNLHMFFNFIFLLKTIVLLICLNISVFFIGCGFYIVAFLRGAGGKQIYTYELVYDFINLLSFTLRLTIQVARIFILTVLFYTFFHALSDIFFSHITNLWVAYIDSDSELGNYIYILFEYVHMFILVIVQVSAFIVMLFWLFQFLFTAFSAENLEHSYIK